MTENPKFLTEFFKLSGIHGRNADWQNDEDESKSLTEEEQAKADEFKALDRRIAQVLRRVD